MNYLLSFGSFLQKKLRLKKISNNVIFYYFQVFFKKQLIALINITLSIIGTFSGSELWLNSVIR